MAKISDVQNTSLLFAEGSAPSTPASGFGRIYVKTTGLYFIGDDGVEIGPLAAGGGAATALNGDRVLRTAGDISTASTSFVDATGLTVTFTTGARRVMYGFTGSGYSGNSAGLCCLDVDVDGTTESGGAANGILAVSQHATASESMALTIAGITAPLSAASHTIKLRMRSTNAAHTFTINASSAAPALFWACEVYAD
jgi:hypothetical protein